MLIAAGNVVGGGSTPPLITTATMRLQRREIAFGGEGLAVSWNKGAQAGVPVPLEGDPTALAEEFTICCGQML